MLRSTASTKSLTRSCYWHTRVRQAGLIRPTDGRELSVEFHGAAAAAGTNFHRFRVPVCYTFANGSEDQTGGYPDARWRSQNLRGVRRRVGSRGPAVRKNSGALGDLPFRALR